MQIKSAGDTNNRIGVMYDNGSGTYGGGYKLRTTDSGSNWIHDTADDIYFDFKGGGKFLLIKTADNFLYQAALTLVP